MKRPADLPESLSHRLNSYALAASAAGVGVLALTQATEAKVIYTPVHIHIPPTQNYRLDINQDGTIDFTFTNALKGWSSSYWNSFVEDAGDLNAVVGDASVLRRGAVIGPTDAFEQFSQVMLSARRWCYRTSGGGGNCSYTAVGGNWNRKDGYLGLKFFVNGKVHYGWLRLKVGWSKKEGTPLIHSFLQGYAYEAIPNKAIIAGKTHGKDVVTVEPASLGHLARGASAIPAWRGKE